jgi:hypothetical protein
MTNGRGCHATAPTSRSNTLPDRDVMASLVLVTGTTVEEAVNSIWMAAAPQQTKHVGEQRCTGYERAHSDCACPHMRATRAENNMWDMRVSVSHGRRPNGVACTKHKPAPTKSGPATVLRCPPTRSSACGPHQGQSTGAWTALRTQHAAQPRQNSSDQEAADHVRASSHAKTTERENGPGVGRTPNEGAHR